MNNKIGILLTNIGTPAAPTPAAVRRYLKMFLSDRRVVEVPRFVWWPILYGAILPFRAKRSARLYQAIWTEHGSPLWVHSQNIAHKLQAALELPVEIGMQYSHPSIAEALQALHARSLQKIVVFPLYPQYSATTTAAALDSVVRAWLKWRNLPSLCTINDYSADPGYIQAICRAIQAAWQTHGKKHLLFSFHGIPQRYVDAGDPYAQRCQQTVHLITEALQLTSTEWSLAFQSRLGRAKWLAPYTDEILKSLPQQGITDIQVVCPGFAADCLETLEEIALRGKEQFLKAGGKSFYYIPALNDSKDHIIALANIIKKNCDGLFGGCK